jgi:hypothetical protein
MAKQTGCWKRDGGFISVLDIQPPFLSSPFHYLPDNLLYRTHKEESGVMTAH